MTRQAPIDFIVTELRARLTTSEVCALGRIKPITLWRRRRNGTYKLSPVDRAREDLYDRDAVLKAFGMVKDEPAPETAPDEDWTVDEDAIREARARRVRGHPAPRGRDLPGAIQRPAKAPALRVVSDHSSAIQDRKA